MQRVSVDVLKSVYGDGGADGAKRLLQFVRQGLAEEKFTAEQVSPRTIGLILGALDPFDEASSFRQACAEARSTEHIRVEKLFTESNPGLATNAFQVVTSELISNQVIAGYDQASGMIGDELVQTQSASVRNQKVAGFTSLAGPLEVKEGHPYSESAFDEKWVSTSESKKGRILSINEELILFDQTGEIARRARNLGELVRQDRERTIVRGVIDADSGSAIYVYRPSGTGTTLYATTGANKNWIGAGGVSGFDAAVPLVDWTDVEAALTYRATKINDDRIDGTAQPILGLNSRENVLLVPEKLSQTGSRIVAATQLQVNVDTAARETRFGNEKTASMIGKVLSSPFIDQVNGDDWFYGNFKKQFLWTEIWPVQTFMQGGDSEAHFDRDVAMRVKVRYYGGLTALDTVWVTKVDGA